MTTVHGRSINVASHAGDIAIALEGVTKRFGDVEAVREVSLEVRDGEFFSLLGSSGCGKTTTLRMIAGFQEPDRGRILLDGVDVTRVPPNRRAVNMVFQNYALFPHMTVQENVAFGLKLKKVPRDEQRTRVADMLRIVRLEDMGHRRPSQLSGGQQQRVALARALVNRPTALLLDEPLGALDVKLRRHMGLELKRIQAELGTTFVYVTHDQEEALSLSDRIAIMNHGVVEQTGVPREVYERPASVFVADFVGVLNAVDVRIDEVVDGAAIMHVGAHERVVVAGRIPVGGHCTLAIRPEHLRLSRTLGPPTSAGPRLEGRVAQVIYLGTVTQLHVETSLGVRFVSVRLNHERSEDVVEGTAVTLTWDPDDAFVLRDPSVPIGDACGPVIDG